VILTVDLGTSVTKAVVWDDNGRVAVGRSPLQCTYSAGNRAEQDPASWWPAVVAACESARSSLGPSGPSGPSASSVFGAIEALGFAAARQTFVPVTADFRALGPALLWSDRRAAAEAAALGAAFGGDGARSVRRRTGVVLDGGSVAAKVAWLVRHEPDRINSARWFLAPRDLMAWRLTGEVCTDHTLASATGLFALTADDADSSAPLGLLVPGLVDAVADRLPPSRPSDAVAGGLLEGPAAELGLPSGIPVVIGAGDRACEALGTRASETWPMVSWGTTANVSVPVPRLPHPMDGTTPEAMIVTRGALGGWLLEGGLSAAGSLLDWLGRLAGLDTSSLMQRAGTSPPGARGVIVLPWLGGARAPWWRDSARGAMVGLSFDHDLGDMARAVVESVAWDVQRCLESSTATRKSGAPQGLVLGGGGANVEMWTQILAAVTGLPLRRQASGEAASAGAAMLVARGAGLEPGPGVDGADPVEEIAPDASMVACYASLRPTVDAAAHAVIGLASPGAGTMSP